MSVISDLSFLDVIFDKEDIKLESELIIKEEDNKSFSSESYWENSGVDILDSVLFNQSLDFLDTNESFLGNGAVSSAESCLGGGGGQLHHPTISRSVCSDSGLSSDQQLSPISFDEMEEEPSPSSLSEDPLHSTTEEIDYSLDILECVDEDEGDEDDEGGDDDEDDLTSQHITLHKSSDDDDPIDVCTVKPNRPVVRVRPSVSTSRQLDSNSSSLLQVPPSSTQHQGQQRSILIPVKGKGGALKTIKIIKPTVRLGGGPGGQLSRRHGQQRASSHQSTEELKSSGDEASPEEQHSRYPRVQLTEEEKRLMVKEGISIPSHYPLTKQEERDLKRIRRKIRNKISAQDSRKRKKEYVDGLEDRVKQCSVENANLLKRVKALQSENQSLSTQLRKLQALLGGATGAGGGVAAPSGATQPATCLMVLVLSLALIMAPNLRSKSSTVTTDLALPPSSPQEEVNISTGVRSRTVLSTGRKCVAAAAGEFLEPPLDGGLVEAGAPGGLLKSAAEVMLRGASEHDHDYTHKPQARKRSRGAFIEPPLDESWPPPKISDQLRGGGISGSVKRNRTSSEDNFFLEEHNFIHHDYEDDVVEVEITSDM